MTRSGRTALLLTLACSSCSGNIHALYEEARLEALADPGPVPPGWSPDAELGLSWELVTTLAARELQQRLESPQGRLKLELPLGLEATVVPDLELRDTQLRPAAACATCVRVDSAFEGELDWKLGQLEGSVPLSLEAQAVLELVSRDTVDGSIVEATLKRASVQLPDDLQVDRLKIDLEDPLSRWVQERIERDFTPIPVAEIGTAEVPIRGMSLATSDDYLLVRVLTSSPLRSGSLAPHASGDWYLSLDEQAVLGLARRDAFEEGELELEIFADPRSLSVSQQEFSLGLRLWRLAGAGWWRDYQVAGTIAVEGGELSLEPREVAEVDHSRGAALADPLALLAEGMILEAIEEALHIARPAQLTEPIGGAELVLSVDRALGGGGALSLQGSATVKEKGEKKSKQDRKSGSSKKGGGQRGDAKRGR